jgi:hypothetical protein
MNWFKRAWEWVVNRCQFKSLKMAWEMESTSMRLRTRPLRASLSHSSRFDIATHHGLTRTAFLCISSFPVCVCSLVLCLSVPYNKLH